MAIVTRYFGTASAGAGDGTSWADRTALFSGGNWSSVITSFSFAANSMEALIGPGNYSCSQLLQSGTFSSTAPTIPIPLILQACDSSGNLLTPPNPSWKSNEVFDETGFPVIATTTNIGTLNLSGVSARLIKFTASGRNGSVILTAGSLDWCSVVNSTSNTSASAFPALDKVTNTAAKMTGSSYGSGITLGNSSAFFNVRVEGNVGSSGNRDGVILAMTNNNAYCDRITSVGHGGHGFTSTSSNVAQRFQLINCAAINNAGDGIRGASTASQTNLSHIVNCLVTGNGGYGINAQSAALMLVSKCRLRDNTSGNFNGLGNYPTDLDNYTTDSDDATEFMDATNGDFRIKNTAATFGMGFGVSDGPAAGGAGGTPVLRSGLIQGL